MTQEQTRVSLTRYDNRETVVVIREKVTYLEGGGMGSRGIGTKINLEGGGSLYVSGSVEEVDKQIFGVPFWEARCKHLLRLCEPAIDYVQTHQKEFNVQLGGEILPVICANFLADRELIKCMGGNPRAIRKDGALITLEANGVYKTFVISEEQIATKMHDITTRITSYIAAALTEKKNG